MSKTIWVLIEIEDGKAARSSLEVLGKAAHLGRAEAIVLGSADAEVVATLGHCVLSTITVIHRMRYTWTRTQDPPVALIPGQAA